MPPFGRFSVVSVVLAASAGVGALATPTSACAAATPPNGSIVAYTLTPAGWSSLDVTPNGGLPVQGNAAPFVDPVTGFENVYAISDELSGSGDLVEYTRFANGSWQGADIMNPVNTIAENPVPFVDPLTGYQNVYASSNPSSCTVNGPPGGHLLEYTRFPAGNWKLYDLTDITGGQTIAGDQKPFVDPLTGFQNVYASSNTKNLIEFTRLPAGNWTTFDVSAATGSASLDPQPFVDPLTGFQNVYATSPSQDLLEYTRLPDGRWVVLNITGTSGGGPVSDIRPFTDPLTGYQNVYARKTSGDVAEFTRLPAGNWVSVDLSAVYSLPTVDQPAVPFSVVTAQILFGAKGGHLIEYARDVTGAWKALDLTQATNGEPLTGVPAPTIDPSTHLLNVYGTFNDSAIVC